MRKLIERVILYAVAVAAICVETTFSSSYAANVMNGKIPA